MEEVDVLDELEIPPPPQDEVEEAPIEEEIEDLGIPVVPTLEEVVVEETTKVEEPVEEEEEFTIPDIPIDVEKEED